MAQQQSLIDPSDILDVVVYPPLGIPRVGNAEGPDDYFLASEVVGAMPAASAGMRDSTGRIKRQAMHFRVYARLKSGSVRKLMRDNGADIVWWVNVANLKASWYAFTNALDLPAGVAIPAKKRNPGRSNGSSHIDVASRKLSAF